MVSRFRHDIYKRRHSTCCWCIFVSDVIRLVTGVYIALLMTSRDIVQELCESRGGRPGLSVLTSLLVSMDVKNY